MKPITDAECGARAAANRPANVPADPKNEEASTANDAAGSIQAQTDKENVASATLSSHSGLDVVTVLVSRGKSLAKTWQADGKVKPYDNALWFQVEEHPFSSLEDLSALLTRIEKDPTRCIIRGKLRIKWRQILNENLPRWDAQRKSGHEAELAKGTALPAYQPLVQPGPDWVMRRLELFEDTPHHWLMLDVDGFPIRQGDMFEDYLAALPKEFQHSSFHWQMSNSAGHPKHADKLKAHLWFWSDSPHSSADLRAWAGAINAPRIEGDLPSLVDSSLFNAVQIHYTASPIFEDGVIDPIAHRSALVDKSFLGGELSLVITPTMRRKASTPTKSKQELVDPRKKKGLIGAFHRAFTIEEATSRFIPTEFEVVTESRWTWNNGGGAPEGVFVRADRQGLGASHNTWPWGSDRTANTYDIVRHFRFGHLDVTDIDLLQATWDDSPSNRNSHHAMMEFIKQLPEVQAEMQLQGLPEFVLPPATGGLDNPVVPPQQDFVSFPEPYPGVMADVVAAALLASPKPQPELSTLAALIGMAACCSGTYHIRGARLNLYGTGIADTGQGKDMPRAVASAVAMAGNAKVIGKPGSGQGLEDILKDKIGMLCEIDEVAHLMQAINGSKAPSYLIELAGNFLKLFSASQTGYNTRVLASVRGKTKERFLAHPCLNLLGFATPQKLGEALTEGNIQDGLMGRMLFAFGRDGVPIRRPAGALQLPESVKLAASLVCNAQVDAVIEKTATQSAEIAIQTDDEADRRIVELMTEFDVSTMRSSSPLHRSLLARSFEKFQRVAAVLAVWDDPGRPVINTGHVQWAEQLIKASNNAALNFCGEFMHAGMIQADAASVLRALRRILKGDYQPQRGHELALLKHRRVAHSFLLRVTKLDKRRFDEAIAQLVDLAEVRKEHQSGEQANGKQFARLVYSLGASDE